MFRCHPASRATLYSWCSPFRIGVATCGPQILHLACRFGPGTNSTRSGSGWATILVPCRDVVLHCPPRSRSVPKLSRLHGWPLPSLSDSSVTHHDQAAQVRAGHVAGNSSVEFLDTMGSVRRHEAPQFLEPVLDEDEAGGCTAATECSPARPRRIQRLA